MASIDTVGLFDQVIAQIYYNTLRSQEMFGVSKTGNLYHIAIKGSTEVDYEFKCSLGQQGNNILRGGINTLRDFNIEIREIGLGSKDMSLEMLTNCLRDWETPHIIYLYRRPNMRELFLEIDDWLKQRADFLSIPQQVCTMLSGKSYKVMLREIRNGNFDCHPEDENNFIFARIFDVKKEDNGQLSITT